MLWISGLLARGNRDRFLTAVEGLEEIWPPITKNCAEEIDVSFFFVRAHDLCETSFAFHISLRDWFHSKQLIF